MSANLAYAPKSSPGGRGPNSPDGPHGLLRGSESAEMCTPAFRRQVPEAPHCARRLRGSDL
eukprot:6150236-Alexandrium_andersonii.AAC.1